MNGKARTGSIKAASPAVVFAAMTLVAIVACQPPVGAPASLPAPSDRSFATSTVPASPIAAPSAGADADVRPEWVADLAGQLACDGPMNQIGEEVPAAFGPIDPARTPQDALANLLRVGNYAWLPAGGFDPPQVQGHWALYRYVVDGSVKAIAVGTDQFTGVEEPLGWDIVGLRACDPSEFDLADGLSDGTILWRDAAGDVMPATRIFSRAGPGHCGWEGVTFLHIGGELYFRDPEGALAGQTALPFKKVDTLPSDAVDTGMHTQSQRLFRVTDPRAIYARYEDGTIERWGRALDQVGCM